MLQQLLIHTRLGVEALDKGGRNQLGKVFIACLVLAQQDQMIVAIDLVHLIKAGAGGHIDLTADDWLDARLFGRLVKLHTAVHHTVVGAGNGSLAALLHPIHQLVNAAGTVQQTVFCMDMEVDEVSSLLIALTGFDHFVSSFSAFSSNLLRRSSASASSFFIRCESPDLLTGGSKQAHRAVRDKSGFSIRMPRLLQDLGQCFQRTLLLQKTDCTGGLGIGPGRFAQICGITIGLTVDLVAQLLDCLLGIHPLKLLPLP